MGGRGEGGGQKKEGSEWGGAYGGARRVATPNPDEPSRGAMIVQDCGTHGLFVGRQNTGCIWAERKWPSVSQGCARARHLVVNPVNPVNPGKPTPFTRPLQSGVALLASGVGMQPWKSPVPLGNRQ